MSVCWEEEHLWLYVLALGFDPAAGDYGTALGRNMFEHANRNAFHVIARFLFDKLDRDRATEMFRDCFPVGAVMNPEFRKECYEWLRDIENEDESISPKITPSSLISPYGPKLINQLYLLARYVVTEDLKRNCIGMDVPFAEALRLRPVDVYMANTRCSIAYNKLLQIFQKEDFVMQEYEKKAQLLVKEIKQMKSEYAALQTQSCEMQQNDQNNNDRTERIQKVRSMWTFIVEILTSLKEEKEAVDSVLDVLEGRVAQCILDGTNAVSSIPHLLAHRIESNIHQTCTGNLYEAEKLNLLTVIQVLNEALRTLRDVHCQFELKQLHVMENRIELCKAVLRNLKAKRLEREEQHCVSSGSICREQEDWKAKWKNCLGVCPFDLMLEQDPELGLSTLPPHLAEGDDEDSVLSKYLESVSDMFNSIREARYEKVDGALEAMTYKSTAPPEGISSVPLELTETSENKVVLIEKEEERPVPPQMLKNGKDESTTSEILENAGDDVIQTKSPIKKEDPLMKSRDELAELVAKTVVSESPQSSEGNKMALEDLVSSLAFNPFLTRKQIPRTPENLLTEIRSSWRKAIQTEGSSEEELTQTEVTIEEAPMDDRTSSICCQKAADSRFMCFIPACPVSDFDSPQSEKKAQLSSTEFTPQEQMSIGHIVSPGSETSGMRESERTEGEELTYIVLNESSVEDPEEHTLRYVESLSTPDTGSENNSRTNILHSDHFQYSLMEEKLQWSVSSLLDTISHEPGCLGILDETLPELGNIDSNKSASSESDFDVRDSAHITGGSENKEDINNSKLKLQSLLNTYNVLRKTASGSEEELHHTHNGGESVSSKSDPSHEPEEKPDELSDPLELFCLDKEFTKTPSPKSLNERKYSLPSLLVSCQYLEEMASMVHEIPLDIMHRLKDKEQLNKKLDTEEPSSE